MFKLNTLKLFITIFSLVNSFINTGFCLNKNPLFECRIEHVRVDSNSKVKMYVAVEDLQTDIPILNLKQDNFRISLNGLLIDANIQNNQFKQTSQGIHYSLVIVADRYLEGKPFEELKKTAYKFVKNTNLKDRISFYTYAETIRTIFEYKKKNKKIFDSISKTTVSQKKENFPYKAMLYVLQKMESSPYKRKILFFISYGREGKNFNSKQKLYSYLTNSNIPIYFIGFRIMNSFKLPRLHLVSKYSNGKYSFSYKLKSISGKIKQMMHTIKNSYVLTFNLNRITLNPKKNIIQSRVLLNNKTFSCKKIFAIKKRFLLDEKLYVIILISIIILIASLYLIIGSRENKSDL